VKQRHLQRIDLASGAGKWDLQVDCPYTQADRAQRLLNIVDRCTFAITVRINYCL
jgi:hypothetical protein